MILLLWVLQGYSWGFFLRETERQILREFLLYLFWVLWICPKNFVPIWVMLSSLARFGISSNTRLTVMILERDWNKERERKTNYKEEKIVFHVLGVWVWQWVCLVYNFEREREREWHEFFLAFRLLVYKVSFIYIKTGESMRVWNRRRAEPNILAYQLQFAGTKYLKIAKEVKKSILGLGDVKCCRGIWVLN